MKIALRVLSIAAAGLALLFALFTFVMLLQALTTPRLATLLLGLSLFVTALIIVRSSVWLWSGPGFWRVCHKRAEVCTIPALVLGMLAAMYYTPPSDDPHALTKFIIAAEIVALLVYLAVRFTFGIATERR